MPDNNALKRQLIQAGVSSDEIHAIEAQARLNVQVKRPQWAILAQTIGAALTAVVGVFTSVIIMSLCMPVVVVALILSEYTATRDGLALMGGNADLYALALIGTLVYVMFARALREQTERRADTIKLRWSVRVFVENLWGRVFGREKQPRQTELDKLDATATFLLVVQLGLSIYGRLHAIINSQSGNWLMGLGDILVASPLAIVWEIALMIGLTIALMKALHWMADRSQQIFVTVAGSSGVADFFSEPPDTLALAESEANKLLQERLWLLKSSTLTTNVGTPNS